MVFKILKCIFCNKKKKEDREELIKILNEPDMHE